MSASFLHVASSGGGGASSSQTITATTAGSFLVAAGSFDSVSTGTPTIAGGGTWAFIFGPTTLGSANQRDWMALCPVATAGTTNVTITYHGGSNPTFADIYVWEATGLTNVVADKVQTGNGNSTSPASGSTGTLSSADEFICAYAESANAVTAAGGGAWTDDGVEATLASWGEHQVVTTTAAVNATFTSLTGAWGVMCGTFMSGAVTPPAAPGTSGSSIIRARQFSSLGRRQLYGRANREAFLESRA